MCDLPARGLWAIRGWRASGDCAQGRRGSRPFRRQGHWQGEGSCREWLLTQVWTRLLALQYMTQSWDLAREAPEGAEWARPAMIAILGGCVE